VQNNIKFFYRSSFQCPKALGWSILRRRADNALFWVWQGCRRKLIPGTIMGFDDIPLQYAVRPKIKRLTKTQKRLIILHT